MADNVNNIFHGTATVEVAPYVAPIAGAEPTGHSFVDAGATFGGVSVDTMREYFDLITDHNLGVLDSLKLKDGAQLKFNLHESDADRLIIAMDQPTANVSGSAPNKTIVRTPNTPRVLKAVRIVGTGYGIGGGSTNKITITAWRCVFKEMATWGMKKDGSAVLTLTCIVLHDTGITAGGASQDMKIVYS